MTGADQVATPCGLIAKSMFTDSYALSKDGQEISIDQTGIAWQSDIDYKFNNSYEWNTKPVQWLDMEDEHFIVWMRTAGLPNFRKLWGKIDQNLEAGTY